MKTLSLQLAFLIVMASAGLSQITSGDWTYTLSGSNDATIIGYSGPGGAVTIPSSIDGNQVTQVGNNWPGIFGGNNTSVTSVTIPDGVISIGFYAFQGCSALTSVTIPDSVTSIGSSAFLNCSALTSVTIPDSVTSIGSSAFFGCSKLNGVTIPNSVTNIGDSAFLGCALTSVTIPDSVTSIGSNAFLNCSALTSVTIGSGLTAIGNAALNYLYNLTAISVDPANPAFTSVEGVLFNKALTSLINYPAKKTGAYIIPDGVTSIESGAFAYCTSLTSVSIPNSVTSIGFNAFAGCTALTSVSIPDGVTSIPQSAFSSCSALTSVTIPDSVTSIGAYAFSNCASLTSVSIGSGVTNIGQGAFSGCGKLTVISVSQANPSLASVAGILFNKALTELVLFPAKKGGAYTIPDGVTSIAAYAFQDCATLTSVTIPDSVTSIGSSAFLNCSALTSVSIPNSVTSIKWSTFSGCSALTSVSIGSGVTSIADYAFHGCYNLTAISVDPANPAFASVEGVLFNKALTSLITFPAKKAGDYTIPESVTSIGWSGFVNCTGLTSISIPSGVTNIDTYTFEGCSSLTAISVDPANPAFASVEGVLFNKVLTSLINYPAKKTGAYIIPDGVTSIESRAFAYCTSLTSVSIPNSVTSIGFNAFVGCTALTSVSIPDGVTSIGDGAFFDCSNLTAISVDPANPAFASVEGVLFNKALTSLIAFPAKKAGDYTMPESVTSLGWSGFVNCTGLTSISIPSGVTNIDTYTFEGCSSLTAISVDPANPAFASVEGVLFNKALTSLIAFPAKKAGDYTIPESVTSIGDGAFAKSTALTRVTIPDSVTSIGWYALYGCSSLTAISVDPANTAFTSVEGVLFNKEVTSLIAFPAKKAGAYTIPESVTSIGDGAFAKSTALTSVTISDGVTSIGDESFSDCTSLTSVTMPDSVTSIGWYAFSNCSSLQKLYFLGNSPSNNVGGMFEGISPVGIVYYRAGTTGWLQTFNGWPTQELSVSQLVDAMSEKQFERGQATVTNNPSAFNLFTKSQFDANRTNGQSDVATNPSAYNLFTQQQFQANREAGRSDVVANPTNYNLFTEEQFNNNRTNGRIDVTADPLAYDLFTRVQFDANRTNGRSDVTTNPSAYNLFTQQQFQANREAGRSDVVTNPTNYNLFTESMMMDMNLGGVVLKQSTNANSLELEFTVESKDNLSTNGWQIAERISRSISTEGGRRFLRVRAGPPYVAPNVKVLAHTTLGNILTDSAGRVLYFLSFDSPNSNPLYSGSTWPYVTVPAAPKADMGVTATLGSSSFGRTNGPFLTINARPAYTYAGDTITGQANGHGSGWVWYTIKADGTINQ